MVKTEKIMNMRKYNILGIVLLLFVVMLSSCEEEERPYKVFDAASVSKGVVRIGISNQEIKMVAEDDEGNHPNYTTKLYVKMFGPPATTEVTVNFTIDPNSEAKLGHQFTLSSDKFVIPAGSTSGSIEITLLNDSLVLDHETPFTYTLTNAGDYGIDPLAKSTTVILYKNCALDLSKFDGQFMLNVDGDDWDPVKVESDPDVNNGILITGPLWYSNNDSLKLTINPNSGIVSGENYFIYNGNAYDKYGRIMFENISGAVTNNCIPVFTFVATPTLPDTGLWWGSAFTFTLTRITEDSAMPANIATKKRNLKIPFKR
jgi:hypothetical protein